MKSPLAMKLLLTVFLSFPTGLLAQDDVFAWDPRTGDAWTDSQLADINVYASRYRGAFIDELVRYHAAPRDLVTELVGTRRWAPGDIYYACTLAQQSARPCRSVVEAWEQGHEQGWATVSEQLGLADTTAERQRMRDGIKASYARWGRPIAKVKVDSGKSGRPEAGNATGKKPASASTRPSKPPATTGTKSSD